VTEKRVFIGTSGQVGYPVRHRGAALALDRATGHVAWQYVTPPSAKGAYGFTGSPDVGEGLVFFTDLAGTVYAFRQ
jgi:outer membrane protein assembly factor BamB